MMNAVTKMFAPDSPERVASALSFLDATDRDQWVDMAFCTKDGLGEAGKAVWMDWSRTAGEKYNQNDAESVWKSAKAGGKMKIATLFYRARQEGWYDDSKPIELDPAELKRREEERLRREAEEQAAEEKRRAAATVEAKQIWFAGSPDIDGHLYRVKKTVGSSRELSFGKNVRRGAWHQNGWEDALLVPIYGQDSKIMSIEAISPKGEKMALKGGAKSGGIYPLAPFSSHDSGVVIIAEGLATAAACMQATGYPAVVAFCDSNLKKAAEFVASKRQGLRVVVAADVGSEEKARAAAAAVGGVVAIPAGIPGIVRGTDFWDVWAVEQGHILVKRIINAALSAGPIAAEEPADEPPGAGAGSTQTTEGDGGSEDAGAVDPVERIADSIRSRLVKALEINPADAETICKLGVDTEVIGRMIRGAFWSGSKSKLFLLNDSQSLNQFQAGDAYKFLVRTFGSPVDAQAITDLTEEAISAQGLDKTQEKALRRAVTEAAGTVILDHLKHHNQREGVEWRCDMFAEEATMHLLEDKARVVLAHKPFEVPGNYEQAIIDDYKQHFTRLDDFLEFLVQSRFALDRKKCYLWILADSDWGKGFLLGVLNTLRISVSTSMKEIEAMFEGRPVGRAPEDFKRAFALVVDEFKTVKSELKQLQSEITLSPKNQLTASVEVFAKLFLSAESVASLVTENGVEDQFANRMSIFEESGSLVKRPLYIDVGNPRYFASVLAYSAETMNSMVAKMQAMGREEAQTHAERWINEFIKRNGIDTVYERFSDSLPDVAADAVRWMHKKHVIASDYLLSEGKDDDRRYYLASPSKRLDEYLFEHFDASEVHAYRRRKPEILKSMSGDGKGSYPHSVNGHQVKAVMLKKIGSDHPLYD